MDITQIILVAVISILTLLLVFVSIQVFLFIHDLRSTLKRANKIVDEIGFQTVNEVLKVAFTARKELNPAKKVYPKIKKEVSDLQDQINGENELEKPFGFALKTPPRFFSGVPKRR